MSGPSFPDDALTAAVGYASERIDQIVERTIERLWSNPALERWTRDETREPAKAIAAASLKRELEALARWELPDEPPEEDLAAARAAVEYDAPVTIPLQCYRAGHAALWEVWLEATEALELAADQRRRVLQEGSDFFFAYVDRCAAWVEAEHAAGRQRAMRSSAQQRMRAVLLTLEGESEGEGIDYPFDARHLGLVVWGARPDLAVETLAEQLEAPACLTVSSDPQTSWAWLADAQGGLAGFEPPHDTWVAVGGPATAVAGFRRAHAEARDAQRVARRRPAPVTAYSDVGLEALGLLDEQRARAFVSRELGPLADGGTREETMRVTLSAYFECGQNAASTAARLGVHERTVANRLRAVEQRLGRPLLARRAELEMALRLREVL